MASLNNLQFDNFTFPKISLKNKQNIVINTHMHIHMQVQEIAIKDVFTNSILGKDYWFT